MAIMKRPNIDPSVLDKLTDGFRNFLDAVVQLVENGFDWGTDQITIRFYTTSEGIPCVDFIDNGQGMDEAGRESYRGLCDSRARGDETKKGRNGTGRLGFIHHALECRAITKTADSDPFVITLDRTTMYKAWFHEGKLDWQRGNLPFGHAIRQNGSGTVVTWYDLRVGSAQAKANRTAETLIEGLAEKLSPHSAPKVVVAVTKSDGTIEKFPLKPREIKGSPIVGELHNQTAPKDLFWNLYVVARSDRSIDHVMMGAMGPVCTWSQFVKPFLNHPRYRELARQVDVVLRHPQVVGVIDIPGLNLYAVNDRKSFSSDLLDDETLCEALLTHLRLHVLPSVEGELGMRSEQIVTTDDNELVKLLCNQIHSVTGNTPTKQNVLQIEFERTRIDLVPGQTYTFNIVNPVAEATYNWDDSRAGGTLDKKKGTRVTYTARELGNGHKLSVCMMGVAGQTPEALITINILPYLPMRFTKPVTAMGKNDRRTVRLENVPADAHLEWTNDNWNGKLVVSDDACEATVLSADMDGDFDIRAINQNNPDRDEAIGTVRIREDYNTKEARKTMTIDDEFLIEGHLFRIVPTRMTGTEDARSIVSWLERGEDLSVISLNFGHTTLRLNNDTARLTMIMREICLRVAESLLPEGSTFRKISDKWGQVSDTFLKSFSTGA